MVINPVSASSAAVTAPQALRPQQETVAVQRTSREVENTRNDNNGVKAAESSPPKPTVNTSGQTVGTLVNVTA